MESIDNFKKISELLFFNSVGQFYFVQIIQRKKEIPELGSNNRVIKSYYIDSREKLDKRKNEIIAICNQTNARAYIHLTPRRWKQICLQSLRHVADLVINEQYTSINSALDTVIGKYPLSGSSKRWVIDIDTKDPKKILEIEMELNKRRPTDIEKKVTAKLETPNGWHLITIPFDLSDGLAGVDVHKNNPTILYAPKIKLNLEKNEE